MLRRPVVVPLVLLVAVSVISAGCTGSSSGEGSASTTERPPASTTPQSTTVRSTTPESTTAETPVTETTAPETTPEPPLAVAPWTLQPGWEQVAILGADPGEDLILVDGERDVVADGRVDELGSLLFRSVDAGTYTIRSATASTAAFEVAPLDEPAPVTTYAAQVLPAGGYGYLETRDGTTLSISVILPGPADGGPYPTVVEYSGYAPSDPAAVGFGQLFSALGYAYVGVNMRGSGCSGGSYRFFEDAQQLDGYDAIETIATQPWVLDNEVGMVGISYSGISQLFVAATRPPSLAAITPLSVLDDSTRGVMYPGGILNTGFGVEWTQQRMDQTRPEGQGWTTDRIAAGDTVCADNQRLRLQNPDLVGEIRDHPFATPELSDPLAPTTFVDRIDVPVMLAGAWQDEQTGGHFARMLDRFTGTDHFYASLVNGLHTEAVGPGVLPRVVEFLDLYVAKRVPSLDAVRGVAPVAAARIFGTDQITVPPDRFTGQSYEQALAAFEGEPSIQVLFEEGAADGALPGTPHPRFVESFDSWPIQAAATAWYLGPGGTLSPESPTANATATIYTADPTALAPTFFAEAPGKSVWAYDVEWQWQQPPPGTAASFVTDALVADTVVIGSGSVDLWIRSDAPDTDLEVTLSEIRPDAQEVYVQSGWLRASKRALDERASTELLPVQTFAEADAAPLPAGQWTPVRIELLPVAHAFRAGSQLRLTVDAPGNSRAEWTFETIAAGETVEIGHGLERPSRIVLPVVAGLDVPDAYPTCTLRGQPCRPAP